MEIGTSGYYMGYAGIVFDAVILEVREFDELRIRVTDKDGKSWVCMAVGNHSFNTDRDALQRSFDCLIEERWS